MKPTFAKRLTEFVKRWLAPKHKVEMRTIPPTTVHPALLAPHEVQVEVTEKGAVQLSVSYPLRGGSGSTMTATVLLSGLDTKHRGVTMMCNMMQAMAETGEEFSNDQMTLMGNVLLANTARYDDMDAEAKRAAENYARLNDLNVSMWMWDEETWAVYDSVKSHAAQQGE